MSNFQTISIKNPDILLKVSKVLDLIFKKKKTGHDGYTFYASQFKKTDKLGTGSVNLINECLLNHRFNEATKLLWVMCQDKCPFDLFLYKGIMVVLENLLSSEEIETIKTVTSDLRKLSKINKLELQLEYLICALKNGINDTEDSYHLANKNPRRRPIKIIPCIEQLYLAYTALINYITWANISENEPSSQTNKDFAFTIIHSFKQLLSNPGIWDIFVLKLIEMLEFYEQYNELEEVLKKYVETNPRHVNAYIYLCVHLHKHNADPEIFIQYAKVLSNLCPSDERVLLLVQKWGELGKNLKKCIKILFAFLDYPVNGRRTLGWQLLAVHLYKVISSKISSLMELITSSWKIRDSSWSYMHFKSTNISTDAFELIQWKVKVLYLIQPDHEYIKNAKQKFPDIKKHLFHNEDFSPSEDFRSLYKFSNTIQE